MTFGAYDMDIMSDISRYSEALMAQAVAFNPLVAWGACTAVGLGALAGVSRAISGQGRVAFSAGIDIPLARAGTTPATAFEEPMLAQAPVEALARPILSGMIEQAIIEEESAAEASRRTKSRAPKGATAKVQGSPARPSGLEKPRAGNADDLKRISGIGPKLEMTLNDLGIYHFDQIAAWDKAEIDWIDNYLSFKGRVERDRWIAQAGALGGRK